MRKLCFILIAIIIYYHSTPQIPITPNTLDELYYEYQLLDSNIRHFAVKPYYKISDTAYLQPLLELHNYLGKQLYVSNSFGTEIFWKKNKLSIWFAPFISLNYSKLWNYNQTSYYSGQNIINTPIAISLNTLAAIRLKTKYINFELGKGRFHIGNGFQSVWQNAQTPPIPYIQADIDLWKVKYVYRISYLRNPDLRFPEREFFHSYQIVHYLDFDFDWITITMFETVIQDPIDSLGARRGFDYFNYLNPVVFFRAIDLSLGSPDNVLIGLGGSLRIKRNFFYGHLLIDEMIVSHLIAQDGCWCLKYGINVGFKSFDFLGLKRLFVQVDANLVRPYTYSHNNPILAYGTLYHPLATPLGANFVNLIGRTVYFKDEFSIELLAGYIFQGQNIDTLNFGTDPFISYMTRVNEYGVFIGQGFSSVKTFLELSYGRKIKNYWLKIGINLQKVNYEPISIGFKLIITQNKFNPNPYLLPVK